MITKQILFNEEVRKSIQTGVDKLANAVKVTLGAKGRNVIIANQYLAPHITKDGVTVAKSIDLADEIENVGARIIKDVAANTAHIAGDGTTTATVLAQAIITHGLKLVAAGYNPMDLKKGIDQAVVAIVQHLASIAIPVDDDFDKIKDIATISANSDAIIGELIASTFKKIGKNGIISIEHSNTMETHIKVVDGMQLNRGYISPHFVTNPNKMEAELENVFILLTDRKIANVRDILTIMNDVAKNKGSLLIIAESVEGEALNALILNKMKGNFKSAAVNAPEFGDIKKDIMGDLAAMTGATIISDTAGHKLEHCDISMLGKATRVTINREHTTIISDGGNEKVIADRVQQIRDLIPITDHEFSKNKLHERLAKLTGGIAVVYVGGASDIEVNEKVDRIDDAIRATKAAIEEGIVPGGGVALLRCVPMLEKLETETVGEEMGLDLILTAIKAPLAQICANGGVEGSYTVKVVTDGKLNYGFNAKTGLFEDDMVKAGIIDPVKVVRVALENAASASSLILTTDCMIINSKDPE